MNLRVTETIASEWLYGRFSATDGFQLVIDTAESLTVDLTDDTQTATSKIAVEILQTAPSRHIRFLDVTRGPRSSR